jgi:tetratricopeptide (TPR) repeat protein
MQVETVAWIMERKNLLSCFFYLLSFHFFVRFLHLDTADLSDSADPLPPRPGRLYVLGILCFIAALLAKSVAASLPAAVLLVCWYKRGRIASRDWIAMLPLLPLSTISGTLTGYLERYQVGANGPDWDFSILDRFLIAGRALWHYLDKLIFPYPLMFFYPHWTVDSSAWWQFLFPLTFLALILALFLLWWHNRLGRGPLAAMLFFAGTLFPALGFVNVYPMRHSFVADHFQYMACIGPLVLFAGAFTSVCRRSPQWTRPVWALLTVCTAALATLTFLRSDIFYNGTTLYSDLIAKNPGGWAGHNLLAGEYMDHRNFPAAVAQYSAATQAYPSEIDNWEGLGNALSYAGQSERALAALKDVVARRPSSAKANNDLASAYLIMNQPQEAARLYVRAIELDPHYAPAYYNLGGMLAHIGQFADAEKQFRAAIAAWSAGDAGGGKTGEGEGLADAIFKLALCLAEQNRLAEALPYFEQTVELRPNWPEAQQDLARARAALGK